MGEEVGSAGLRELCERTQDDLCAPTADRLRRAAHRARPADAVSRRARRPDDRPCRRTARGRASFRQLGRAAGQSRHHPRACARLHHRRARRDRGAGMAAAAAAIGAPRAARRRGRRRRGRPDRSIATGASRSLTPAERVFGWNSFEVLAFHTGNAGTAGECHSRHRRRAHCQLRYRGRHRYRRHHPGVAPPSRPPRLSRRSRSAAAKADSSRRAALDPADPWVTWATRSIERTTGTRRRSCRISADRCPTTFSSMCLASRPSGSRIPMQAAHSMRPTSTCSRPSRAKGCGLMAGLFWDLGEAEFLPCADWPQREARLPNLRARRASIMTLSPHAPPSTFRMGVKRAGCNGATYLRGKQH